MHAVRAGADSLARPQGRVYRAERGRCLQPVAHDSRPGDRERADPQDDDEARCAGEGGRAIPRARAARAGDDRQALSAPGVGRSTAAADGRDGADHRPGAGDPRRADHRARRDHADRRAAGVQERDPALRDECGVRVARPGGGRADGRPDRRAERRPDPRSGRDRTDPARAGASVHAKPDRGGHAGRDRTRREIRAGRARAAARRARRGRRLRRPHRERLAREGDLARSGPAHRARADGRRDRRIGFRQDDAREGDRGPRAGDGRADPARRRAARARHRQAFQGAAPPRADRVPERRYRAQPGAYRRAHAGAAARVLSRDQGRAGAAARRGTARPRAAAAGGGRAAHRRVVRRAEAAREPRARTRGRARPDPVRRGHVGARHRGRRRDHGFAARPAGEARRVVRVHHARHREGARDQRRHRRAVRGPSRRNRQSRCAVRAALPPVFASAGVVRARAARRLARRRGRALPPAAGADRRARERGRAVSVPVALLDAGGRRVQPDGAHAAHARERREGVVSSQRGRPHALPGGASGGRRSAGAAGAFVARQTLRVRHAFVAHAAAAGVPHSLLRRSRKTAICTRAAREYAATAVFDGD
ncbi:hypothetical protein EMIT0158MI4_90017 [Burkholderia ambifaria]